MDIMKKNAPLSLYAVVLFSLALIICRIMLPPVDVLSWDVFGYYLYLPAKFIYGNLSLSDQSWLTSIIERYQPTSTFYQAQLLDNGNWVMKYSMGLAVVYSPFFLLAHLIATVGGYPADGFSLPYQYTLAAGGILFAIIGLVFFRKVLLSFFDDRISLLLLILVVAGTNYFQLTAFDGTLLSHNFLFAFYAMLLWYTIQWHHKPTFFRSLMIGALCGLMILIRPSEMLCLIIPLLWNMGSKEGVKTKIQLFKQNRLKVLLAAISLIVVCIPQLIYWKMMTGHFLYYSYVNPGEGFEFLWPYTLKFLFNFRKGWLIYTPLMIFALTGFVQLYRRKRELFPAIFVFFVLSVYVISSWSCWWYAGASYSSRSLVPAYVLLAIPMGFLVSSVMQKKKLRLVLAIVALMLIILNLFQTWQFEKGILPRDRITAAYYFAAFGKTYVDPDDEKLLLIDRGVDAVEHFTNESAYNRRSLCVYDFENASDSAMIPHTGKGAFKMDSTMPYSPGPDIAYAQITPKDHAWIRAGVWIYVPAEFSGELPLLTFTFNHGEGSYKYRTYALPDEKVRKGQWNYLTADYLTPEVRSVKDNLKVYLWYRSKAPLYIDDFSVDIYEPKD
jgi:hypothetical protein